jgi:predicted nucleotidyltransferase
MTRDEAEAKTILRCLVGSTAHGLNNQDHMEDRDEMGVCIEDMDHRVGFTDFEQFIYRTAAEREGKQDAPSRAGDLDLTIYGLRKYLRLALRGNPTILMLLFTEPLYCDARGQGLRELAPAIIHRGAGGAYLGYIQSQRQKMLGERGSLNVHRQKLVAEFGYDTKFAMHMCRLGFQGIELMNTGTITLPVPSPTRELLLRIRTGQCSMNETLQLAGDLEADLKDAIDSSPLPKQPDTARVEQWMIRTYLETWKAREPLTTPGSCARLITPHV